jgi:DnaK suppressor protein
MEARNRVRRTTTARPHKKADTQSVIGSSATPVQINGKWQSHYQTLLNLRDRITRSKEGLIEAAKQEQPIFSLHEADAATDQYDLDFALTMISTEQNALYEIDQALTRIQNGTYGVCELTGRKIEPDRLKVIPWTRFSTDAQKQIEQRGGANRVKLGDRQSLANSAAQDSAEETESDTE